MSLVFIDLAVERKSGLAICLAKSGRLIIKLDGPVPAGSFVFDEKGRKIAKVAELIGPVRSPYASAIPLSKKAKRAVGKRVYFEVRRA